MNGGNTIIPQDGPTRGRLWLSLFLLSSISSRAQRMQHTPKVLKCTQGGLHNLRRLTTEDQLNSDKTSTKIGSETTRTYRDHVVQTLPHLPCRQRQSDASSSRPIPAATLFLAASRGLDPLRRRYAPASPRPIRTPNEMIPPLAVPEGSQACW